MKKLLNVLLSFMLSIFAFSCNEPASSGSIEFTNKEQIQSVLQLVGQDHNKGLEFIYTQLSIEKSTPQNFNELINSIKTKTNTFLSSGTESFVRENIDNAKNYASISIQDVRQKRASNAKISESENLWKPTDNDKLTTKQKELLSYLNDAINDESLGFQETLKVFETVRIRAKSECSEQEVFTVLAAVEVGVNSLTYWHENIDKWANLMADIERKSSNGRVGNLAKVAKKDFSWKSVGKSDVSGAVGAAVGVGVAAVVTGPPGWAAGGAAVAGGAVGASATDAVGQLLDSWFGD
jgi:hypothetical protein